ncbi:hypothetical protein ZIOFF_041691 [Zingiber officinale]|uniref:Protein kinase domain-containing protein n=1 Tax=Zingiber officinale TaxID=94328 RepID=A0A8J5L1R5_ZINOF|nr:hypothetical protein ZIOFF_041691 [Zingiber officinale]
MPTCSYYLLANLKYLAALPCGVVGWWLEISSNELLVDSFTCKLKENWARSRSFTQSRWLMLMKCRRVLTVQFFGVGLKVSYSENLSSMTIILPHPSDGGSPMMTSIEMLCQGVGEVPLVHMVLLYLVDTQDMPLQKTPHLSVDVANSSAFRRDALDALMKLTSFNCPRISLSFGDGIRYGARVRGLAFGMTSMACPLHASRVVSWLNLSATSLVRNISDGPVSTKIDDKLYIYLEYVSGGSIHKLLQDYGQFGEPAIRSYTQQILSGLAYLHAKNTVHRDIKGANILVDPNGRVKLADFGMAKHITGQSCPLSFKGSPYWMAPEIAAMFKIGNSKELPRIPDHLSDDGKDFIRHCLQREPSNRPTASELLQHPFVKNASSIEKSPICSEPLEWLDGISSGANIKITGHVKNLSSLDMEGMSINHIRGGIPTIATSDVPIRYLSCPVSPMGSPHLNSRSPCHARGRMSPSPISSPIATSGASTPLTGGNGAIPFSQSTQHVSDPDGFTSLSKCKTDIYLSGTTYHEQKLNLLAGMQQGSLKVWERKTSKTDILSTQFGRLRHGNLRDLHKKQSDRLPPQSLRDQMKLKPSQNPSSGLPDS